MAQKIQMRRDSVENWLDVNPILARGEWGVAFDGTSTDVIAIKIGDGESDWESLQSLLPINSSDTGGGGLVADAINDGTTTVAPSQNAVFDALALKITNPGGANDDFLQRKAGAWTSRTPAQVKADMSIGVGDVSGFDEQVRDVVGTALVAGSNVTITVNDESDTITIASTGGGGGGNASRTIRPYIAFNSAPITDAFWAMAPAGTLIWILQSNDAPRGFYRADGTDTLVRATEYDSDYLDTDVYLPGQLVSTLAGFASNDPDALIGQNLHWHFRDWNATRATMGASVGVLDTSVFVNYEPTNYTTESDDTPNLGNHLAGIDNAIGEQFLDSVYVPTSGPLVDLATGMELEVETPEVLTLTGNTVHVRSVDQDHTGKTILVECTLVDQHDRTGRRLKGFEMVGTASDAYSFALTLNGSLTPLDGSAWENGHREDLGIYLGSSGKAVAELSDIAHGPATTAPFSRSAQFTSPIPSNDLDDHRISIIVTTGLNPTFNGVIETKFEVVPIWEDANESYTPSQPSVWEDIDSIPENKNEALDLLADAIDGLNGGVWRTGTSGQTWPAGARTAFIFADTEDDPFTATLLAPARDGDSIDVFRADTSANELRILPSVDHTFASGDPYITLAVGEHVRLTWDTEGDRWFIAGS